MEEGGTAYEVRDKTEGKPDVDKERTRAIGTLPARNSSNSASYTLILASCWPNIDSTLSAFFVRYLTSNPHLESFVHSFARSFVRSHQKHGMSIASSTHVQASNGDVCIF